MRAKCSKCGSILYDKSSDLHTKTCPICSRSISSSVNLLDESPSGIAVKNIIELFGIEILKNKNKFLSVYSDYVPNMKKEKRILSMLLDDCKAVHFIIEAYSQKSYESLWLIRKYLSEIMSDSAAEIVIMAFAKAIGWESVTEANRSTESQESNMRCGEQIDGIEITDPWKQYEIGYNYEFGTNGYIQDYGEAIKWYKLSAVQDNSWSQNRLGEIYRDGKECTKNASEAVCYFRLAAALGDQTAQYNLANCYYNGVGVKKDLKCAFDLFLSSAEQGNRWAQYTLGYFFEFGIGIATNYNEAVRWYRYSAEQDFAWAQNRLGECYCDGKGVRKNSVEAKRWFELAAEQGDKTALNNLKMLIAQF